MELQHINIKIFAANSAGIDTGNAIPIFHRWIQKQATADLLIDVADYRHVPDGPGVVLVAHEAHYALDWTHGRPGLLYNRRTPIEGSNVEKLRQAYDAALAACRRLQDEPEFAGKLSFSPTEMEVIINDRAAVPNTPESFAALRPAIECFCTDLFGEGSFELKHVGEPRERLRVSVQPAAGDSAFSA